MEERAQVSFDYLILLTFVLGLVIAVSVLVSAIKGITNKSNTMVNNTAIDTLGSILNKPVSQF
jgi:hypothetical protein